MKAVSKFQSNMRSQKELEQRYFTKYLTTVQLLYS